MTKTLIQLVECIDPKLTVDERKNRSSLRTVNLRSLWFEPKLEDVVVGDFRLRDFVCSSENLGATLKSLVGDYHESAVGRADCDSMLLQIIDGSETNVEVPVTHVFYVGLDPDLTKENDKEYEGSFGPRM